MANSDPIRWIYFLAQDIPIYRDILPVGEAARTPAAQPFWQAWRQRAAYIEVSIAEAEGSTEITDIIYLTRVDSDYYLASFESPERNPRTVSWGDLPRFFEDRPIQAIRDSRTQEYVYMAPTFTPE